VPVLLQNSEQVWLLEPTMASLPMISGLTSCIGMLESDETMQEVFKMVHEMSEVIFIHTNNAFIY
jgi:hypothetical protein